MELNFNPEKLENIKERFIWITIKYIYNILNKIHLVDGNEYNILLSILALNISTLKSRINNYDYRLDKIIFMAHYKKIDHQLFLDIFIEMTRKIPLHFTGDELL